MLSVFFVLVLTVGIINLSNYITIENTASDTLRDIISLKAKDSGPGGEAKPAEENARSRHYFIAVFDKNGSIVDYNYDHVFSLSDEKCLELCTKVYEGEMKGGRYQTFRYRKTLKIDGATCVAFLDIENSLEDFYNFLLSSSLISLGAYLAFTCLILVASKIAFKPSEEAYIKQKQFITNASHELKTPLTVISADMDLIEMDNGKSEWSESIRDQVARLTKMTNQLVILSRLEEDDLSNYPFETFSLNEVFEKAVNTFTPSFIKENIAFTSDINGDITINGNHYLVEELVYIFLDNSLKYTGGENKTSNFSIRKNNKGKTEFEFSNSIDKDDETDPNQVMERFYRAPSNKKEGSGVGLSIAKEIINLHKGKIKVDKTKERINFLITFE